MNLALAFKLAFGLSVIGWIALFLRPRSRMVNYVFSGMMLPVAFAVLYTFLCIYYWHSASGSFLERFGSLDGTLRMFNQSKGLLFAGYVHYLAFDLFIGSWIARRATADKMSYAVLFPCLFLTLVFGPAGLLLYRVIVRARGGPMLDDLF
ncbi:MAG: DUF4281 domain-containing protein [Acidobacteria bacterium]|nr:DUF4281 domain-containing protein [Acidobacteriota bacterium]MBV9477678.1 DUF4281 domain-containing protein [Acidobacteriota bacterium]